MAATASRKHFGAKLIKYIAVLCIKEKDAVTGVTISNCNNFLSYTHSVTSAVSWRQKRQHFIELSPVENNIKKFKEHRNTHSTKTTN